jgi:hypothetical protein
MTRDSQAVSTTSLLMVRSPLISRPRQHGRGQDQTVPFAPTRYVPLWSGLRSVVRFTQSTEVG